jgi:acetyltransferase-like isoleucine patch superfamily enzyme
MLKRFCGFNISITNLRFGKSFTLEIDKRVDKITISDTLFRDYCAIRVRQNGILNIKKNVFFNSFCSINCRQSITIGENTIFGENVKIYDHNHKYNNNKFPIVDQGYNSESITIGDNCWIGSNVIILKGVHIGNNSIIGAGTIIYKNVPDNSLVITKQDTILKDLNNG